MVRSLAIAAMVFLCLAGSAISAPRNQAVQKQPAQRRPVQAVSSSLVPANGGMINTTKPMISAEFMDDGIGVSSTDTKLYIDEQDVSASAQITGNKITYTPAAPLGDGAHRIKLNVVDKAGNASLVEWSFTIHTSPPQIKITSHKPNHFINRSPVTITGTINDARARIVVNGISAFIDKNIFTAKVNLIEGQNTITAVATDIFGNVGNDSVILIVDTKPPVLNITSPTPNSLVNTRLMTVTGVTDQNVAAVTVITGPGTESVPVEVKSGAFTAKDIKLEEGVNAITVKAVSLAGNSATASVRVLVDSIPPKLAITAPRNATLTNKKMITVTGTVDKASAMVKINNTPVQVSKGMFSLASLTLSEGTNTITATAIDRAGNQAVPSAITIVLDTTPPAPPTLGPIPPVTRTAQMVVSGNSEPGARVDVFANSMSQGTATADEKGAFSVKVTLVEGNNAVSAVAHDGPGNASSPSAGVNVFLDTNPPKII